MSKDEQLSTASETTNCSLEAAIYEDEGRLSRKMYEAAISLIIIKLKSKLEMSEGGEDSVHNQQS